MVRVRPLRFGAGSFPMFSVGYLEGLTGEGLLPGRRCVTACVNFLIKYHGSSVVDDAVGVTATGVAAAGVAGAVGAFSPRGAGFGFRLFGCGFGGGFNCHGRARCGRFGLAHSLVSYLFHFFRSLLVLVLFPGFPLLIDYAKLLGSLESGRFANSCESAALRCTPSLAKITFVYERDPRSVECITDSFAQFSFSSDHSNNFAVKSNNEVYVTFIH